MATEESGFHSAFRQDLKKYYGERTLIWTNNDMYRVGLPDFSASFDGNMYGIEAKFAKKLPKRGTSKALTHEVSDGQLLFLKRLRTTGNFSAVLVGLSDVAVVMLDLKSNYTLDELKAGRRIERERGTWNVAGFFEHIRGELSGKK